MARRRASSLTSGALLGTRQSARRLGTHPRAPGGSDRQSGDRARLQRGARPSLARLARRYDPEFREPGVSGEIRGRDLVGTGDAGVSFKGRVAAHDLPPGARQMIRPETSSIAPEKPDDHPGGRRFAAIHGGPRPRVGHRSPGVALIVVLRSLFSPFFASHVKPESPTPPLLAHRGCLARRGTSRAVGTPFYAREVC